MHPLFLHGKWQREVHEGVKCDGNLKEGSE